MRLGGVSARRFEGWQKLVDVSAQLAGCGGFEVKLSGPHQVLARVGLGSAFASVPACKFDCYNIFALTHPSILQSECHGLSKGSSCAKTLPSSDIFGTQVCRRPGSHYLMHLCKCQRRSQKKSQKSFEHISPDLQSQICPSSAC